MGQISNRIYRLLGVTTPFDPQHRFTTSYLISPLWLALWRSLLSVYTLVTIITTFVESGASQFSFFTVLSYWGLWGWLTISAIHTFSFWFSLRKWSKAQAQKQAMKEEMKEKWRTSKSSKSSSPSNLESAFGNEADEPAQSLEVAQENLRDKPRSWLESWPRPFQVAHVLLWSTIATFPLIVTVVFWSILASAAFRDTFNAWDNISVHALNLVFATLEVFVVGRGPMLPWWNMLLVFILIGCYLGVAYITYATQGFYTYDFLNTQKNGTMTIGYIVGIGIGSVVSFLIGQFLIFTREYLAAKIQFSGGWGSAKPLGVPDEAMIPTERGPGPEGEGGKREGAAASNLRQRWSTT